MLTTALTISLITIGIHASTWDGMILQPIREWLDWKLSNKYGKYIKKPLYDCLICMSSVWTVLCFFAIDFNIAELPLLVLIVAGINTILMHLIYWLKGYEHES